MEELRGEGTTNCTEVKQNINGEGSVIDLTFKQSNGGMQHGTGPPYKLVFILIAQGNT